MSHINDVMYRTVPQALAAPVTPLLINGEMHSEMSRKVQCLFLFYDWIRELILQILTCLKIDGDDSEALNELEFSLFS